MTKKLGKQPAKKDIRVYKLSRYVKGLPAAPANIDWSLALNSDWGDDGNTIWGNCFWAAVAHGIMCFSANANGQITPSVSDVLKAYSLATGFDPKNPASDVGTLAKQGFLFMQTTGMKGQLFGPNQSVNVHDHGEVMSCLYYFGGLFIGLANFPPSWEESKVWDVDATPGDDGHEVFCPKADSKGLTVITWGEERLLTWPALDKFSDEMEVTVAPSWIAANNIAPNQVPKETLLTYLSDIVRN